MLSFLTKPVPEEQQSGEDFGYIVAFRLLGSLTWMKTALASADTSRYVYKNHSVQPLSLFEVKVGTFNSLEEGPYSPVVRIFSAEEGMVDEHAAKLFLIFLLFLKLCSNS